MSVINESLLTSKVSWAELQRTACHWARTSPQQHSLLPSWKKGLVIISINKDRNGKPERPWNLPKVTQPVSGRT